MSVPSPCINICRMDAASGWCSGCMRTIAEIAAWSTMPDAGKHAVWSQLPLRRVAWQRQHPPPSAPPPEPAP
jgi:predicted Fe-S protein YdhL (DUF1289 family)